jgi:hypothetical protein
VTIFELLIACVNPNTPVPNTDALNKQPDAEDKNLYKNLRSVVLLDITEGITRKIALAFPPI